MGRVSSNGPSIVILVWMLLVSAVAAHAQECAEYGIYSHWVGGIDLGTSNDIVVIGNRAYVASGSHGLDILDVSDPAQPVLLGSTASGPPAPRLAVSGNIVVLAGGYSGLTVVDVSNPSAPVIVNEVWLDGEVLSVAMAGSIAYAGARFTPGTTLYAVDLSVPSSPVILSDTPAGRILDLSVSGSLLLGACWQSGLVIWDLTDPSTPNRVGGVDTPGTALGVAVSGTCSYVADGAAGLKVIDISTPAAPAIVGSLSFAEGGARDVAVSGNRAFVPTGFVSVVDIASPTAPSLVTTWHTYLGGATAVACRGSYTFVAHEYDGVQAYLNSAEPPLQPLGQESGLVFARDLEIAGRYAFIADDSGGLAILDLVDPIHPAVVSHAAIPAGGNADAVAVRAGRAYVVDNPDANPPGVLRIVDVANPASPVMLGAVTLPGWAYDVAVSGGYAFVPCYDVGLAIVEVSNPNAPQVVALFDTPGYVNGVTLRGNLAFLSDGYAGMRVLDISAPASPVLVGSLALPGFIDEISLEGDRAYAAAGGYPGLHVVDVTDPAHPALLGSAWSAGAADRVLAAWPYAYLLDGWTNLLVYDVSTPASPVLVGTYDPPAWAQVFARSGDYLYLATPSDLLVLSPQCGDAAGVPGSPVPSPTAVALSGPNPMCGPATLRLTLVETAHAVLSVHDAAGRTVRTLLERRLDAGEHAVCWDGTDDRGARVPAGMYFVRGRAGNGEVTRKTILLR